MCNLIISYHAHQERACGKRKRNEGSLPIQDPQTRGGGYGVTVKDSTEPEPITRTVRAQYDNCDYS